MTFPSNLEQDYQADLGEEKIRVARQTSVLSGLLFAAFALLDIWAIPSALFEVWAIRVGVVVMLALTVALTEFEEIFVANYSTIVTVQIIALGLAIEAMILLATPSDLAWSVYYTGLILVVMALYTWTYLGTAISVTIGTLHVGVYFCIAIFEQRMLAEGHWPILMTNGFFFVSANVVGLMSQQNRERFTRANYLLRHALERDLETTEEAKRQSDYLAEHDPLTRLANRAQLMRRLGEMVRKAARDHHVVAAMFIDLDEFKPINDSRGHLAGDLVLKAIAERFRRCVRKADVVARLGGDEFVVALEIPTTQLALAHELARKLEVAVAGPIAVRGDSLNVTASIGVALFPQHADGADSLLAAADRQMYEAKRSGGGVSVAPSNTGALRGEGEPRLCDVPSRFSARPASLQVS